MPGYVLSRYGNTSIADINKGTGTIDTDSIAVVARMNIVDARNSETWHVKLRAFRCKFIMMF